MEHELSHIAVVGNGGWGTALAVLLARKGVAVTIWGHDRDYLYACAAARENTRYLAGVTLPESLHFQHDLRAATQHADALVAAVPTAHLRNVFSALAGTIGDRPVVSLTKGIEPESLFFPSEVLAECCGASQVSVLSGPSMAEEVARGLPASVTVAHPHLPHARRVQRLFSTDTFRVYASDDLRGVELGGAVKNVIAIAAGVCDGMKLGDNAKAALLARGLSELRQLGRALGARDETFAGLSGVGDLYTTCASPLGRNRGFGEKLGRGMGVGMAIGSTGGMVVEGVGTAKSIHALAKREGVEMPICEAVYQVLYEGQSPAAALQRLMSRRLREEDPHLADDLSA